MDFSVLLSDKSIKPKEKTEALSQWLLKNSESLEELIAFSKKSKDPVKATCIEAIEFATKLHPEISTLNCLNYVSECLIEKAPRIKWESAKVIGNIAKLYPKHLNTAISNLLVNSEYNGTVVRWSAACALAEILKLKTRHNTELIAAFESICKREEKNSIRKIYLAALKNV